MEKVRSAKSDSVNGVVDAVRGGVEAGAVTVGEEDGEKALDVFLVDTAVGEVALVV